MDLSNADTKVFIGNDPSFSAMDFDDSLWSTQPLIEPNGWPARGAAFNDAYIWQRIRFEGSRLPALQRPAVYVGQHFGAARFYLNGVEIGSVGMLDEPFLTHVTTHNTKAIPLVFVIPDELLTLETENVLAIQLRRNGLENSGVLIGPLAITEEGLARDKASGMLVLFTVLNSITAIALVIATIVSGILWASSPRQPGIGWLFVSCACFVPLLIVSSTLFLVLDIQTPPLLYPYLFVALAASVFAPLIQFSAGVLNRRIGWFARLVQALAIVLALSHLVGHRNESVWLWMLVALATFSLISFWAFIAVRRKHRPGLPILVGAGALWMSICLALIGLEDRFIAAWGTQSSDLALAVFLCSLAWAGARSVFDSRERLAAVQSQVLQAQETERRRVAYDIHDGVGQWLSAIKLNLQMLQGRHKGTGAEGDFTEVVEHVDAAISDTRRIAHDLSPAMIDQKGLVAAMKSHCDVVGRQSGIETSIQADHDVSLDVTAQGHLYRIFQEALQNAVRHGRATSVVVRLEANTLGYELSIKDNGTGFDETEGRGGLGLESIKQRALLLGASVEIASNRTEGTTVNVRQRLP